MKETCLIIFGNNLRAERNRKKLSQEALAEMAGLQMQQISLIENGKSDLKFSTLIRLLRALNVDFDQLFDLDNWDLNP